MRTITEISQQKNNAKRCNLFLDGEFFCGIGLITVMKNRLKAGDKISREQLDKIVIESESEVAMQLSLNYIARGLKTKIQVVKYLKEKGFLGIVIAKTVDKLIGHGYINDDVFSKNYIEQRKNYKGKRLMAFELKVKGVDEKTIEKAIEDAPDEEDGAYMVAVKFLKGKTIDFDTASKCYRRLLSKGFDYDVSKNVIDRVKRENEYIED